MDRHTAREYLVIGLAHCILERAEDLLTAHALRAFDAVQLASALEAHVQAIAVGLTNPIFLSADRRLLVIAAAEGLTTDDPSLYT